MELTHETTFGTMLDELRQIDDIENKEITMKGCDLMLLLQWLEAHKDAQRDLMEWVDRRPGWLLDLIGFTPIWEMNATRLGAILANDGRYDLPIA